MPEDLAARLLDVNIRRTHEQVLDYIAEGRYSLRITHQPTLDLLTGREGVAVARERVRFRVGLVQAALAALWYPPEIVSGGLVTLTGAGAEWVTDLEDGHVRPATHRDLVDLTRLASSLGMRGPAPVRPMDLPRLLQDLAMWRACWEYGDRHAGVIFHGRAFSSLRAAEYAYEMAQAASRFFAVGIQITESFGPSEADLTVVAHFRGRNVPLWVGTSPRGSSPKLPPLSTPQAHLESIGNLLLGLTLIYLLADGAPVYCNPIDSLRMVPWDAVHDAPLRSFTEGMAATMTEVSLLRFYGIPTVARSLLTSSSQPDALATMQKAMHTQAAAQAGARLFYGAGLLSHHELFSGEQLVLDHDLMRSIEQTSQGQQLAKGYLALSPAEQAALHQATVVGEEPYERFGPDATRPSGSGLVRMNTRQQGASISVREQARQIARRQRAADQGYRLTAEVRHDLEDIWGRARQECLS